MHPAISPSNFHPPPTPATDPNSFTPFLLSVSIVFFIILCFLSILLLRDLFCYLTANRSSFAGAAGGSAPAQQSTKAGLDPAIIASFPMLRYAAEVRRLIEGKYGGECAVCLSEFAAGDVIRLLTVCCHAFHLRCIDSWLVSHRTCPICRSNLEADPDEAAVRVMREVVASGGDSYVISIHEEGEGAAGEGREGVRNTLVMEGGAVERNSGMGVTG